MTRYVSIAAVTCALIISPLFAATFVVRSDRDIIHRADAVVVASALTSYSRLNSDGGIETVTPISIEEVIKGDVDHASINLVEPGGVHGDQVSIVSGAPQFTEGRRMLLFLMKTAPDHWSVLDLVIGKFTFAEDSLGQRLLVRDEEEIVGYDSDLAPHVEKRRAAERFLDFVRAEAQGREGSQDYIVPTARLTAAAPAKASLKTSLLSLHPAPLAAPYTATSYTMTISGSLGSRWNVFPSAVPFYSGTTQEPGAPGGGSTAIQAAVNAWDNDCGSNVNYSYAGADDGTHTQGLHAPDGRNTVLFERDLSAWGVAPFTCSSNGYSGTLGLGGVTSASGSNTVGSETFVTTNEGDVEMNKGLANCTLVFSTGDFNSAVTHEMGHTLGFRHSDQNRASSAACATDPSLECSSSAIMTAVVTGGLNGSLQQWDINAVRAVYPGGSCTTCTTPSVSASVSPSTISPGQNATLSETSTGGVTSVQWYLGQAGDTSHPISGGTAPSITVAPTTTTSYWVWALNSCTSAISNTVTVTVSGCSTPSVTIAPASTTINSGQSVTLSTSTTGGVTAQQWYVGQAGDTSHPIAGAGGTSLTVSPSSTTSYWVWALNSCSSAISNTATVAVNTCATPTATISPAGTTINAGQNVTLTVSTTGGVTGMQWYVGQPGDTSHPIAGAGGSTLTVSPGSTTTYWVWALNGCGGSAISNAAKVTVNGGCAQPTISISPASVTTNPGQSVTLTTSSTGGISSMQWYLGAAGDTSHPISGATGSTLTVSPSQSSNYWVWALNGCGGSAISNTASVFVNCAKPTVSISPASSTIAKGQSVTLTASATGGVTGLQWYMGQAGDTSHPLSGATGPSVTVTPTATISYWVWALNSCSSAVSNTATVTVQ